MEKVYEMSLLLDIYGQMLTPRQYEIMDLHFNNDYSLAEIAEQLYISRQGVFDNIKRGKAILDEYEKKLGLVDKFSSQKNRAEEILNLIKSIEVKSIDIETGQKLKNIEELLKNIISEI